MAIKIKLDGRMEHTQSVTSEKYDYKALAIALESEPSEVNIVDIGPFLLVTNISNRIINSIATMFFRFPVFGDVLLVPGKELHDNEFLTDENTKYEIADVENGILKSIKDAITIYEIIAADDTAPNSKQNKKTYYYDPTKIQSETTNEVNDEEFTHIFYNDACKVLKKYIETNSSISIFDIILYEDEDSIVKFSPELTKTIITLDKMIEYFISTEEYEKCETLNIILKNKIK